MPVSLTDSVTARSGVFSTTVDDELILFDPDQGLYFGSGIVGQCIWTMISKERQVSDICDAIMEQFEVERAVCIADVVNFLSELEKRGLVTVS